MTHFPGKRAELIEALAYELHALEYLRRSLFDQSETSNECLTVTLGSVAENGKLNRHLELDFHENVCAGAVQAALSQLRPLAFSATFKMQDMIVEWILRANDCTDWRFKAKLKSYDRLSSTTTFAQPKFFEQRPLLSKAFWEIFRYFEPYRGTVTHAGGVTIAGNGTLQIAKQGSATLNLSNEEQAAYIQALCIIANTLIGKKAANPHLDGLAENALERLAVYHRVVGLNSRYVRLSKLKIIVPPTQLASEKPLSVDIDWDSLGDMMRETFLSGIHEADIFFPVTVEVQRDQSISRWNIPLEAVPVGKLALTEGDPQFDAYLVHHIDT